jgi:hypothetical protein
VGPAAALEGDPARIDSDRYQIGAKGGDAVSKGMMNGPTYSGSGKTRSHECERCTHECVRHDSIRVRIYEMVYLGFHFVQSAVHVCRWYGDFSPVIDRRMATGCHGHISSEL